MSTLRVAPSLLFVLLASSALLPACKSDTYESATATGRTVQQAADEVDAGIRAVDATVGSLNDLVANPAPDPAPQFKLFSKNLESLQSRAANVRDLAAEMDKGSQSYFAQWDQQIASITNEDIRERSQDRRQKVDKAFVKIHQQYREAHEELQPFVSDLKDVRTALAADLTPDGIGALKKTAGKISKRSEDVKETLTELSDEFRKLGVGLGKSATPAATTKTP